MNYAGIARQIEIAASPYFFWIKSDNFRNYRRAFAFIGNIWNSYKKRN